MSRINRRSWLRGQVAAAVGLSTGAGWSDDGASISVRTVDDDIRMALDDAPLALRFAGNSPADAARWRAEFRGRLNALLGGTSPPGEWTELLESRAEFDDHIRLELLLRAKGIGDLPVYVLIPKSAATGRKHPAMLCLHGHGDHGHHPIVGRTDLPGVAEAIASARYDYGLQFVRRGYVVAAPCLIPFGRRVERERYNGNDPCAVTFVRMQALGQLPIAANLRDCRWAISLLERRPDVDAARIGCAGLSYGGRMTMLTAAIDERVRAAVISGALNLLRERVHGRYSCGSQIIPGLLQYGDHPEIGGLIAPRLAIWEVGEQDKLIRRPDADDFRQRLRAIYAAAGASEQLVFDDFDGGHRWNGELAYPQLSKAGLGPLSR